MKLYYQEIVSATTAVSYSSSFVTEGGSYDSLSFTGILSKYEKIFQLKGLLCYQFNTRCDRCLEPVKVDVEEEVLQLISPTDAYIAQQSEAGLTDEEADLYATGTEFFDLAEFLHEEAILTTPFKRLCIEDCKGICEKCGANLNSEPCTCKNKGVDSRWSKLVDLTS